MAGGTCVVINRITKVTDTTKLPNTINKYTAGAPTLSMLPLDLKDALKN